MEKKNNEEFYTGCAGIAVILFLLIGAIGSCTNSGDSGYSKTSPPNSGTSHDPIDPISWRAEEEKMEKQIPGLRDAKYSCKRCGMKSDRELNDPDGIWGRDGICAYCIDYLKSKR